ncbi:uncharacterized protein LOC129234309 [Uloborus diversus]|uniref:uncharacterized protein LOC129234309 n=1 Tax=Uloborus diversus TaxID=327109 RepID=UPI0024096EE2|nr:uncharacterized protein LOC129234309 [Uloborus diversus]
MTLGKGIAGLVTSFPVLPYFKNQASKLYYKVKTVVPKQLKKKLKVYQVDSDSDEVDGDLEEELNRELNKDSDGDISVNDFNIDELEEYEEIGKLETYPEIRSQNENSSVDKDDGKIHGTQLNLLGDLKEWTLDGLKQQSNKVQYHVELEKYYVLLPDYSVNQELTNSTFDGSNTSWSSSDWNAPRAPKSEPNTFYKYQGSYQAGDWSSDPSYGVMHQSSSPSASSSSYYDANNDYYGYGYGQGYGQQAPYGMQQQQQNPYPPVVRPPCDAPYNGSRIPSGCPPGKQMFPDYRRQNRFGLDAQGRIQHIKREPEDAMEQDGENFTSLFTKSLTSLYSQDAENAFPDESKSYDPDVMILDPARPQAAMDDGGYHRMNASYGMGTAGYPNHQGPRQNFGGYYENRNQIPEPAPSVVQDLNAESERVNSFRYDRPSFDDMHLYASSPNDTKSQAKKRKLSTPNSAPEGGSESRRKAPRLVSFKSDSKWTPNSYSFSDVTIKQEPLDEYEDGESQNRCLVDNAANSNGNAVKASVQPTDQPKPVVRKRSPGTTCFDRFEKKSTPASKKVSPLSVYAKVQDSLVLSVKCRRYKKRTKPIAAKEDSTYPGREEIENWKRTGAYSQSPDQAVRLLMNELIDRVSHMGDRSVPEGPELPPVDLNKDRELLYQFCKRYSIDYSDFENAAELKPRMVVTEPTKNFERASAFRKRTNISPMRSKTPTRAEVKAQKNEKVTRKVVVEAAKSRAEVAKTTGKRTLRKLPRRSQRGRKLRGRSRKAPVVTRRYSTRSAKEDGHSDVDIVIGSSSEDEKEAGKEAEVPKKSQRLKNKHPVVETPAKANSIERNNSRICVKKEDVNVRSRSKRAETEKQEEVAKLSPLKKKWSRLHETECALAETVTCKKNPPVNTLSKDIVKTESNNSIKTSDRNSNKNSPKTSSRKSADKIICDSVLCSPTFNLFSRQTRRKSFDVVEIDCEEKEAKPADDNCYVKLVKHSETKPCDKPFIKKEPVSPDRKRGASRDNSLSKTRLKSCDVLAESKKLCSPKQSSSKEANSERQIKNYSSEKSSDKHNKDAKERNASLDSESCKGKKKFQADLCIKEENMVKEMPRDRSFSEPEKRQAVISKLEVRSRRKDVPKASGKKLSNAGKPAGSDKDSENSSPKKKDLNQVIDKTDSVVQIKLTKLPLNFSCESSSLSESSPEDSLKVIIKNRQARSKSKTHSRKKEPRNENEPDAFEPVASVLKSKNEVLECQNNCDKADGNVHNEKEDSHSNKTGASELKKSSEAIIHPSETLEVPHRRKRNRPKCTDSDTTNPSPKTGIPHLEPKIAPPETKDTDAATPTFDLRNTILKIKSKIQAQFSDEQTADNRDKMNDKSPSTSEPPKLDCMKESHPETIKTNSKENKSDPGPEETSPDSISIVCESMPSIFPVPTAEAGSRPQPITIHRRSDSDDSDCGGLVIDLDRRQSVEDQVPSPAFEIDDPKPSKDTEPTVQREPTPSTSGYSSSSRDKTKWGLDDSDDDDDCLLPEGGRRRQLNITFSSLETAAKEHAKKIKDREESILRSLLLDNAEATPGTSQDQPQSAAYNISPESKAKIQSDIMRILMHQANQDVSASTAAGGFDLKKMNSNSLPTDMNANIDIESEDGQEDADNLVEAKEKITKLKNEIVYLQCMADQKDQERTAIVFFKRYKEEVLGRLVKEYSFNVQDHIRDWLQARLESDPDESQTPSGTQTSSISFATSLANDDELDRLWNEFVAWVENRSLIAHQNTETSAPPDLSLAEQVLRLANYATEAAASGPSAATPTQPSDAQSGEQLPAVAAMVASATENYGVDMRTIRNGGMNSSTALGATTQTILQKALSSSRDNVYIPALRDPIILTPSTSRSSPSTEASTSTAISAHHPRQSFRTFQRNGGTSAFRSMSPPLPDLRPSRKEDRLQPIQKSKPPTDPPSRSPPALQPELRLPVPKIFSPQPKPPEKQYPLDLIVTTSATVSAEAAPTRCEATIKKKENAPQVSASNSQSSSRRTSEKPPAEAENLKPETSSKSENSNRKLDTQYTKSESHREATVIKTETTYRKTDASASVSDLPPRDPASVPGSSKRDLASGSGLPPKKPSGGDFTFENRFTGQSEMIIRKSDLSFSKLANISSPASSKPEGSYVKSESPFSLSESPFTKPGPSPKPVEAATASSFKEGSKNRRVTSSPKRRPGYSYSPWNNGRNPEASATLDLRTENARSKDSLLLPKKEPSTNGHSSSRQKFMTVPPPTMLQQSQTPSSPSSSSHQSRSHSSGHHHEASHKSSIERIYTRSTEEELRSMSYSSIVETNGLAYPLVKMAMSMPETAGPSGVKCLGCGVSDAKFLCSGCRKHWYCSPHCQTMRWPEHSRDCGRFFE